MGVVIVGVGCLGGSCHPPGNPTFTLASSRLNSHRGHHSCSFFEWLAPLGCPFLEGLKDPSSASNGLTSPTLTMVISNVVTSFPSIMLGQPQLGDTLGFPPWPTPTWRYTWLPPPRPPKVVPSWAIKATWKLMPQKSHSPLGKEILFPTRFENPRNLPLFPLIFMWIGISWYNIWVTRDWSYGRFY
jgi:hypothetical protein